MKLNKTYILVVFGLLASFAVSAAEYGKERPGTKADAPSSSQGTNYPFGDTIQECAEAVEDELKLSQSDAYDYCEKNKN